MKNVLGYGKVQDSLRREFYSSWNGEMEKLVEVIQIRNVLFDELKNVLSYGLITREKFKVHGAGDSGLVEIARESNQWK